jgi:cytochrome c nitrite reductase small subunit
LRGWLKWIGVITAGAALAGAMAITALWGLSRRPAYCGWCHIMEPYSTSWASGDFLARRHAVAGIDCLACHPRRLPDLLHDIVVTVTGTHQGPVPGLKVTKEQCFRCHGDYPSVGRLTASLKVNPHASHLGEEQCFQCHKMHRQSPGMKFCFTCHHTGDLVKCHQCHKDR